MNKLQSKSESINHFSDLMIFYVVFFENINKCTKYEKIKLIINHRKCLNKSQRVDN